MAHDPWSQAPGAWLPTAPAPAPPQPSLRAEALTGVACAAGVALLGAPVGLLWSALAPRPDVVATADGGLEFVDVETRDFFTADAWLLLLAAVAGVVAALVVWRLARRHALGALLGLLAGAAIGAFLAARTGVLGGDRDALIAAAAAGRLHTTADLPLELHARIVELAWPATAALTFAGLLARTPRWSRSGVRWPPGSVGTDRPTGQRR